MTLDEKMAVRGSVTPPQKRSAVATAYGHAMSGDTGIKADDDAWEDLVIAMLAVNNCSLEKLYRSVEGLRQHGLLNARNLAVWDESKIAQQMRLAGYDRGGFMTPLFARRLSALGKFVQHAGFEASTTSISESDRGHIEKFLSPVEGIGPTVLRNFYALRGI